MWYSNDEGGVLMVQLNRGDGFTEDHKENIITLLGVLTHEELMVAIFNLASNDCSCYQCLDYEMQEAMKKEEE